MKQLGRNRRIKDPCVVGAVIDLGLCLDLATSWGIAQIKNAHATLRKISASAKFKMPKNNDDGLRRNLDCAVVRTLHGIRKKDGEPGLETVRGVFLEGKPIFRRSGFHEKTHIQICVCDPQNIKGVFRVDDRFLR